MERLEKISNANKDRKIAILENCFKEILRLQQRFYDEHGQEAVSVAQLLHILTITLNDKWIISLEWKFLPIFAAFHSQFGPRARLIRYSNQDIGPKVCSGACNPRQKWWGQKVNRSTWKNHGLWRYRLRSDENESSFTNKRHIDCVRSEQILGFDSRPFQGQSKKQWVHFHLIYFVNSINFFFAFLISFRTRRNWQRIRLYAKWDVSSRPKMADAFDPEETEFGRRSKEHNGTVSSESVGSIQSV